MTTTRIRRLIAFAAAALTLAPPAAASDRHVQLERSARARRRRNRCAALVFACALLVVAPAGASAKVFLELPGVPGESTVAGFDRQIELDSFQLELSNRVQMGTEKVTGKPSFSEIVVSKTLDKSSPTLMLRTADMAAFPFARVRVTRSSSTGESAVVRYCFTNVRVTSFSQATHGDLPVESISLSYGTIVQSYTQQAAAGVKEEIFSSGWDVIGNLQFGDACK
jgi:type VI secretion system secreted protein Hcp